MPMIIGEIKRYLRDNNSIRISRSTRDLAYRALQIRDKLSRQNSTEPSAEEIVAALHAEGDTHSSEEIISAMEAIIEPISLFDPIYGDGSNDQMYVMDQIADHTEHEEVWLENIALKAALLDLSPREKHILSMRFYRGKTQMEVASEIGISQAQVSRIEKNALDRIKKEL